MRSVLESPWAYNLMQVLSGWHVKGQKRLVSEVAKPSPGDRVLDIGCGTGAALSCLGQVDYTGLDMNPRYIAHAQRKHGDNGRFLCADVNEFDFPGERKFDLVLMFGLLHHLSNEEASRLLMRAWQLLDPNGRLVTMDNCHTDEQGWIERRIVDTDRGEHVRPIQAYLDLAKSVFPEVTLHVRRDLLHYAFTLIVMECSRNGIAETEPH